jgi:dipeptidyl aminopeptidase/acylaminoacyl peptidase
MDLAAADAKPVRLVVARGSASSLRWSPDGSRLAFVSNRGTHSFIGVHDGHARAAPGSAVDRDSNLMWSLDGTRLAFAREFAAPRARCSPASHGGRGAIRVADAKTGAARVWKAEATGARCRHDVQPGLLGAGDLVFRGEGWVAPPLQCARRGRFTTLLTPGEFEVDATLTPDRAGAITEPGRHQSRHAWVARVDGSALPPRSQRLVSVEPGDADTSTTTAFFRADARTPPHLAVQTGEMAPRTVEGTLPVGFPTAQLVEPQPVMVTATDGMPIHAQLFVPPDLKPNERRPALIFSHGGSRRQMLLGWHYLYYYRNAYAMNQWLASRGYIVLSVNYRSGIGYGLEFREAVNYGATGGSEFQDIMGAGLYLKSRADVDPARIGLWGGSYGGYLTAMGLSRASNLFAAGVDFHGVHDWNQGIRTFRPDYNTLEEAEFARKAFESSPLASVDTWRSPVLLIHGDDDRNVSFVESVNLIRRCASAAEVEQLVFRRGARFPCATPTGCRLPGALDFFDRGCAGKALACARVGLTTFGRPAVGARCASGGKHLRAGGAPTARSAACSTALHSGRVPTRCGRR